MNRAAIVVLPFVLLRVGRLHAQDTVVVDRAPQVIPNSCQAPRYPAILRQAGIQGHVLLSFVVTDTGRADSASITVVRATHPLFAAPARAAVLSCRFVPAQYRGAPVAARSQQEVNFALAPDSSKPRNQ